jgi:hypothetical protein
MWVGPQGARAHSWVGPPGAFVFQLRGGTRGGTPLLKNEAMEVFN